MFVACGIWCLADVSSVSPSSEQTIQRTRPRRKTVFFKTSLRVFLHCGIHSSRSKATLEPNPKMFPESNATNADFTRVNNTQLFSSGWNLVATETADFLTAVLFVWEKSHVLCKRTVGVRKIANDGLSKTRIGALRYWTVWMDEPILS